MTGKVQSEAARRSDRHSRIISIVGYGTAVAGLALFFMLRKLGWSPEAAMYAGLLAAAPVFAGLLHWVWRRNTSAAPRTRQS